MFQRQLKSTFLFLGILLVRFFVCVGIGYLWFIGVPFIFYMKAPHLETLEGYYIDERVDGDLLEFYSIAEEIETYGADNKALAERVVIVARIGTVGFVWVFPALGFIWGLSQKKGTQKTVNNTWRF